MFFLFIVVVFSTAIYVCRNMNSPNGRPLAPKSQSFLSCRNLSRFRLVRARYRMVEMTIASSILHHCRDVCSDTYLPFNVLAGRERRYRCQLPWCAVDEVFHCSFQIVFLIRVNYAQLFKFVPLVKRITYTCPGSHYTHTIEYPLFRITILWLILRTKQSFQILLKSSNNNNLAGNFQFFGSETWDREWICLQSSAVNPVNICK